MRKIDKKHPPLHVRNAWIIFWQIVAEGDDLRSFHEWMRHWFTRTLTEAELIRLIKMCGGSMRDRYKTQIERLEGRAGNDYY